MTERLYTLCSVCGVKLAREHTDPDRTCTDCGGTCWSAYRQAKRAATQAANGGRGRTHGTIGGYNRHKSRGETPCETCVQAQREYHRARKRNDYFKARRAAA